MNIEELNKIEAEKKAQIEQLDTERARLDVQTDVLLTDLNEIRVEKETLEARIDLEKKQKAIEIEALEQAKIDLENKVQQYPEMKELSRVISSLEQLKK